jgi:hypothetical protein
MDTDDIRYRNFVMNLGGQRSLTPVSPPTWSPELADAFALIEVHDRRVGLVLFHTQYHDQFVVALRDVLAREVPSWDEEEQRLGTLWGAEVWCSHRVPVGKVLIAASPEHIDPMKPVPGLTVEIIATKMFPGPDQPLALPG